MSPSVSRLAALVAAAILVLVSAVPALAHAELVESSPEDGAVLTTPPTEVVLEFSEGLDAEKSSFKLEGPAGEVGTGVPNREGGRIMTLSDLTLGPGAYEVRFTAAAEDGHIERGRIDFTVEEAAPPTPEPTAEPTAEPTTEPTARPTPKPSGSPSAAPTATPSPRASASSSPSPSPTASPSGSAVASVPASAAPSPSAVADEAPAAGSGTDVLLPIVAGLVLVALVGAYVLRRSRGA